MNEDHQSCTHLFPGASRNGPVYGCPGFVAALELPPELGVDLPQRLVALLLLLEADLQAAHLFHPAVLRRQREPFRVKAALRAASHAIHRGPSSTAHQCKCDDNGRFSESLNRKLHIGQACHKEAHDYNLQLNGDFSLRMPVRHFPYGARDAISNERDKTRFASTTKVLLFRVLRAFQEVVLKP